MLDNAIIEEQEKAARILKQWRRLDSIVPGVVRFVVLVIPITIITQIVSRFLHLPKPWTIQIMLFTMNLCMIFFFLPSYFRKRRLFLQSLTEEETAILERASRTAGVSTRWQARQLLKERAENQPDTKKELLRSSQQTQDNTLLLPTTYTDNAPQEQLLRPTQNDQT